MKCSILLDKMQPFPVFPTNPISRRIKAACFYIIRHSKRENDVEAVITDDILEVKEFMHLVILHFPK